MNREIKYNILYNLHRGEKNKSIYILNNNNNIKKLKVYI